MRILSLIVLMAFHVPPVSALPLSEGRSAAIGAGPGAIAGAAIGFAAAGPFGAPIGAVIVGGVTAASISRHEERLKRERERALAVSAAMRQVSLDKNGVPSYFTDPQFLDNNAPVFVNPSMQVGIYDNLTTEDPAILPALQYFQ